MEKVQSNLLNQVRIVAKGQPIVAWISKFSSVTFTVGKFFFCISSLTENISACMLQLFFFILLL